MPRKLTTNEFIEKAQKIHGDKYSYEKVDYRGTVNKIEITCREHGSFWQKPNHHTYRKQGCPSCSKRNKNINSRIEEFIINCKETHGNKYDYSECNYVNNSTKIKIKCKKHGIFELTPSNHLRGTNCLKCSRGIDYFLKQAKEVHGNRYEYKEFDYNKKTDKVPIICKEHGEFIQTASLHIRGYGCPTCGIENQKETLDNILKSFKKSHGDLYNYSKVKYVNYMTKVKIGCSVHGIFEQSPASHIKGHGCNECARDIVIERNREKAPGWTIDSWIKSAEKSENFDSFKTYIIKCWNEEEEFYKIGRTYRTIEKRFYGNSINSGFPYKWEIMSVEKGTAEQTFNMEKLLKQVNKEYKYKPLKIFGGSYECFSKIKRYNK